MVLKLSTNKKLKNNPYGNINLISIFSAKKNHRNSLANDCGKFRLGVINVEIPLVLNCPNQVKKFLKKKLEGKWYYNCSVIVKGNLGYLYVNKTLSLIFIWLFVKWDQLDCIILTFFHLKKLKYLFHFSLPSQISKSLSLPWVLFSLCIFDDHEKDIKKC